MDRVRLAVEQIAAFDFTVLITGESGTGKEVVARTIHARSRRQAGPFIAVSGAALVDTLLEAELFGIEDRTATGVRGRPGKLELADGGTFFLDEVAELSRHAQAALLRVLQDLTIERVGGHRSRRVDTRIIVATNQPLRELMTCRQFRADLFYRLSGVEIPLPPLRDRRSDVLELAEHFFAIHGGRGPLPTARLVALGDYAWPGNVRELERFVQRMIVWPGETDTDANGPVRDVNIKNGSIGSTWPSNESLRSVVGGHVEAVLERSGGNKALACRRLGISYHTLQRYLGESRRSQIIPVSPSAELPNTPREATGVSVNRGQRPIKR